MPSTEAALTDRVCLTAYAGPPRGGCYERLLRLSHSLAAHGWTVHFVGLVPPEPSHPSLVFHPVQATGVGSPSLRTLIRCARTAAAVSLRQRVRFLWSFGAVYAALLAPLRLLPGRRLVTFLRGSLVEQERANGAGPFRRLFASQAERMAIAASDKVVAVSSELARRMGENTEVLPNDVDALPFKPRAGGTVPDLVLPRAGLLVGYAGSISPIKSLETLLQAVARVPDLDVALRGFSRDETSYERSIRKLVTELGLTERVHLLRWAEDARPFLAAVDVVVLPSRHEGCPNLLLEAMAMGRPCLGARSGGIEEVLLHEELLFPHGDVEGLAGRLRSLMDNPGERNRLAAIARERASAFRFDWEGRALRILEKGFRVGPQESVHHQPPATSSEA